MEKCDTEAKGVQDILLEPKIICMFLLLAKVLVLIKLFSRFLETGTSNYNSISAKLNRLLNRSARIKEELQNHSSIETELFFLKAMSLLKLNSEHNNLGHNSRDRTLVNHSESPKLVNKFLRTIANDFINKLFKETDTALKDKCQIIPAFNVFLSFNVFLEETSLIGRNDQLEISRNHYGKDITDTYQSKSTFTGKLIDLSPRKLNLKNFFPNLKMRTCVYSIKSNQMQKRASVGRT